MTMMSRCFKDKEPGLYPYSSIQINLPALLARQIIIWGEHYIKDKDIYCDQIHGREDEIHITLLYGVHSQLPNETQMLLKEQRPFEVKLGRVSIFTTSDEFNVVKIEAISPSLFYFNHLFKNNLTNTPNYIAYKPHVTIAYIKKNVNYNNLIGNTSFENWRWVANTIIFSSKNGAKTPIRLNTAQHARCS